MSFANSPRYCAAEGRPCGVPTDCCTTVKRPSSTREPGSVSASVTSRGFDRVGPFSRCREGDQVDRYAQPLAELTPQIHGYAAVFAARAVLLDEKEVTVVDPDAELPRRGQLGSRGGRRRHAQDDSTSARRDAIRGSHRLGGLAG